MTAPRRRGRPSAYRDEFARQARRLALLGATDEFLAESFGVAVRTIARWKTRYPEFRQALKESGAEADANVALSLYRRAMGFSHQAVKIFADPKTGKHIEIPYTEQYPPDTTAGIFWLKNRQPALWRDRAREAVVDPAEVARQVRDAERAMAVCDALDQGAA